MSAGYGVSVRIDRATLWIDQSKAQALWCRTPEKRVLVERPR